MKVIVNTHSNYGNLNGKELDVIEIAGTHVSCLVFSSEFQKDITIDFCLSEVCKFTDTAKFPIVMGIRAGFYTPIERSIHEGIFTVFENNEYYILFKSKEQVIAKIKCYGNDIAQLRNFGIIDK